MSAKGDKPADPLVTSSHTFGITYAVDLARTLCLLPPAAIIYGVEGGQFAHGASQSAEVVAALPRVTAAILAEIEHHSHGSGPT